MSRRLRGMLCTLFACLLFSSLYSQDLWSEAESQITESITSRQQTSLPGKFRLVRLNSSLAKQLQGRAPLENLTAKGKVEAVSFPIPLPGGIELKSSLIESPILSRQLQAQLRHVKTYKLVNAATKNSVGRITITPDGVTGLIFTDDGSAYISPLGKAHPDVHMVYYVKDMKSTSPVLCGVKEEDLPENIRTNRVMAGDCQLRTYRLAVAATGEYTDWAGSQAAALTSITTTVNDVNAIYERDVTMRFTLVTNNSIIYPDSLTDPYVAPEVLSGSILIANDNALDANIGVGNYDVGIVFNFGWDGGLAGTPVACSSVKGAAGAGLTFGYGTNPTDGPQGPIFTNTVAHEIAHTFSATHTFSANNAGCAGNVDGSSSYEPGGGSTIMSYGLVCTPNFFQRQTDSYFHTKSIEQILDYAINGSACANVLPSGNTAPVVTVPAASYTIPISTPFALTASATDADGNNLFYNWEQVDIGTVTGSAPSAASPTDAMFRSFTFTSNPTRTFPNLPAVLTGLPTPYEVLPSGARTMNFQVTVRDLAPGAGCTDEAAVAVTTDAVAGPFTVTSQNLPSNWTANGSNTEIITWSVASTDLAPINCANVDILFSTDGGNTWPYTLATATPNDGSHTIIVPNLATATGRIRVQASNNIFFNVNTSVISITSTCTAEGTTVTPNDAVSAEVGDAALNLGLSPEFGSPVVITGTITTSDAYGYGAFNNGGTLGNCFTQEQIHIHDTFRFTVNVAGMYTFQRSGATDFATVYILYGGDHNPTDPCTNYMASSIDWLPAVRPNYTVPLVPGVMYTMSVGTFNPSQPVMPFNYTINVTPPAGGGLFTGPVNPGGSFNYTYVVVNNSTGNIVAIDPSSDMTNGTNFPAGDYTVYGLSYSNSILPATLNAYIGGPFTTFQNDALYNPALCGNFSRNTVSVGITASLPVDLQPLKAVKENNTVVLKWSTLSEQNSSHFDVLRAADGANFETLIGKVQARGNSNAEVNYTITDAVPLTGRNYYRLRQVDLDGSISWSNVAHVDMGDLLTRAAIYPSPANSTITLTYNSSKTGAVDVLIFDSKGAVVQRARWNAQAGTNVKTHSVAGLAKGIYAVQIAGADGIITGRFIKE